MNIRACCGETSCILLALAVMPAPASARQGAAAVGPTLPRVAVVATDAGYVIAARDEAPRLAAPVAQPVRIGVSTQIDHGIFERLAHHDASAGQ